MDRTIQRKRFLSGRRKLENQELHYFLHSSQKRVTRMAGGCNLERVIAEQ